MIHPLIEEAECHWYDTMKSMAISKTYDIIQYETKYSEIGAAMHYMSDYNKWAIEIE